MAISAVLKYHWTPVRKLLAVFGFMVFLVIMVVLADSRQPDQVYNWTREGRSTSLSQARSLQPGLETRDIVAALGKVMDPELGVSVLDLGLIYDLVVKGSSLDILMTLTSPKCPLAKELIADVKKALIAIPALNSLNLRVTFDPPWTLHRMSPQAKAKLLGGRHDHDHLPEHMKEKP